MVSPWIVERLDPAQMTAADAKAVAELNQLVWPQKDKTVEAVAAELLQRKAKGEFAPPTASIWFVVRDGTRLLAKAQTWGREIGTSRGTMTIMALAGVCSRPEVRGRGLGAAVVRASFARVDSGEFPFSLFQTSHNNLSFYKHLGAVTINNRIVNSVGEGPQKNPFWDELVMRYPARPGWPEGEIDLRGEGY